MCLREVSKVFQGCFKGVSRKIEVSSESSFRVIQGSFKVCIRSSKGVSRQFHRCFKKVLRVFRESVKCVSRKFYEKFQGYFKNISMKFCFVILLLHGSHRSYPSRSRTCFLLKTEIHIKFWIKKHFCEILGGQDINKTKFGSEINQFIFMLSHRGLKTSKFSQSPNLTE